ncbi:hypothetical protein D0A38_20860 [Xanthomonas campestris pv. incanae]|nr:hypothetical protein D0A38_20860 [Xanthomonas campestris pv. incanae]
MQGCSQFIFRNKLAALMRIDLSKLRSIRCLVIWVGLKHLEDGYIELPEVRLAEDADSPI